MAEDPSFLDPSALARLENLELVARRVVEGFMRGHHESVGAGSSTELREHREYAPGDDLRRIDWRAFARNDRVTIRQFEDETNVRVYLVLDVSGSMAFDASSVVDGDADVRGVSKLRYAICLAAAIGWLLLGQRDAVGLVLAADGVVDVIPPRATARNFAGVLRRLEQVEAHGLTRLGPALAGLAETAHRNSLVLVFSDFIDDPEETLRGVARMRQRAAEVFAFEIHDPAELRLPFDGWTVFRDAEGESAPLRLDARGARELYRARLESHLSTLEKGFAAAHVDHLFLLTNESFEESLGRFLHLRARRGR